jgi:hypothetical protein
VSKAIALCLLVFPSIACCAQNQDSARLQCEGTYDKYTSSSELRDIPVKGIFLDISEDHVTVQGAVGFDATYSIITRRENGLGIQLDSDASYSGFLNRFSGELSLAQKGDQKKDGSYKLKQHISATCKKAQPLF